MNFHCDQSTSPAQPNCAVMPCSVLERISMRSVLHSGWRCQSVHRWRWVLLKLCCTVHSDHSRFKMRNSMPQTLQ